jgi:hypothetical protein
MLKFLTILMISTQFLACNLFQDFADKTSRDAMMAEAERQIDKGDYKSAIAILNALTLQFPADPEIATLSSSAYAAAGGIGLMDIGFNIASMATSANPTDRPFEAYLSLIAAPTATELGYSLAARDSLIGFSSDPAKRTNEMNMYLTILSYGIVGTILSVRADINPNDDITDTAFDCNSISDDDTKEVIYTYAIARQSAAASTGASLWNSIKTQVNAFTTGMESLGIDLSITSKSQVDTFQCEAMKSLLVGGLLGSLQFCPCN